METSLNSVDKRIYISSDDRRIINTIQKLKRSHPEDVHIIALPKENDGCIYAHFPINFLKISPPIKRNLTDEQRKAMSDRAKMMQRRKHNAGD